MGRVQIPAGTTRIATLGGLSVRDASITSTLSLDQIVVDDSYYHQVVARVVGQDRYSFTVRVHPNGNLYLLLARRVGGVETVLRSTVVGQVDLSAGEQFTVRFDVVGQGATMLRGTVWRFGEQEPSAQLTATDSTATMQREGAVGLRLYAGGEMSSVPLTVAVDGVRVTAP